MFENYLEHPDRHPKNAQLLSKYQNDIDKLSEIFTEDDLLHLMTQEQPDGTRKMRPSLASVEIFAPSASTSNQINFFSIPITLKNGVRYNVRSSRYWLLISMAVNRLNKIKSQLKP